MKKYHRLHPVERELISRYVACGKTHQFIADKLGRNKSTICREVKRNSIQRKYTAYHAQMLSNIRLKKLKTLRLERNIELYRYIEEKIQKRWSPMQISKRLEKDFPKNKRMRASHEAIYMFIYRRANDWIPHLRQKRRYRKNRKLLIQKRQGIREMVSIEQRPPEVENRSIYGHWEGDLIVGKNQGSVIGTLVERTTRKVIIIPLKSKKADVVRKAFVKELVKFPEKMRLTLTYDQGTEMSEHKIFTQETNMKVYFAHPHSPWERGTNENTNGLIRDYFPKGTDFNLVRRDKIKWVEKQLNNRPRAVLNWQTPHEEFRRLSRQQN
jgi:transposase, IS30 family